MNLHYDVLIHSPLPRAKETASIIHRHLSHLPIKEDEFIEEGGPIAPKPTVTYWGLPDVVSQHDAGFLRESVYFVCT